MIGASLTSSLWNSVQGRFQTGFDDSSNSLDVQSWGSLWLLSGQYATVDQLTSRSKSALQFANEIFFTSQNSVLKTSSGQPQVALGYGPYSNSTVWSEGSLGVALAYLRRGDKAKARAIVKGLLPLVAPNGGVLYAANKTVVDSYGDVFYPYPSVAGTAWLAIVGSPNQYILWNADPLLYSSVSKSLS